MFVHIFSFRWQATATEREKAAATAAIRAFATVIPGLSSVLVGENISPKAPVYGTTGVMVFETRERFEAYLDHPAHKELLEWLKPLIEAIELDFDADEADIG